MTRSVEIPEAAVEAAVDVLMDYGHNGLQCDPTPNFSTPVRRALEAALPYLAPAACTCPTDADVTPDMRTETGQHLAACPLATHRAAPAGDGGLREALERLVQEWRYTGKDLKPWQEGGGPDPYESAMDQCATELKRALDVPAAPAVPQPAPVCTNCEATTFACTACGARLEEY